MAQKLPPMPDERFLRFVVRPGCKGGLVGFNHRLFEEGIVYEVIDIYGGEIRIKKLGLSPLALPPGQQSGFNNGMDYNRLYTEYGGSLLLTVDEFEAWKLRNLKDRP